ncbi:MAG: pyruvate kinase [Deltaproteobacteria bacterium]|nr:pyruvate kinase [Deltaproteobacteria bacterium]
MKKNNKFTKILCTIGPASDNRKIIKKMYQNGMNGVRINTAHGDFEGYQKIIDTVRSVIDVPIVLDIKGPEVRIRLPYKLFINKNTQFKIYASSHKTEPYFSFNIIKDISEKDKILIDDGKYICKIIKKAKDFVIVRSKRNIELIPNKSINIPERALSLPSLSEKDIEAIRFAQKNNIEYIALSFVRDKNDLINLREKLAGAEIKIIAKIENRQGVENIDEILENCAGVMIARGDLGVELSVKKIPRIQKEIITKCNNVGKISIVATQILESMVSNPTPTRAEVSDITNAILDGADCLMLSQETAVGDFPVECVKQMSEIANETEKYVRLKHIKINKNNISENISLAAANLAKKLSVKKIICMTRSGYTAKNIVKHRVNKPVIAIVPNKQIQKQLMLCYSITPFVYYNDSWDYSMLEIIKQLLKDKILEKKGDILFTTGRHSKESKRTTTIEVHNIKDLSDYMGLPA